MLKTRAQDKPAFSHSLLLLILSSAVIAPPCPVLPSPGCCCVRCPHQNHTGREFGCPAVQTLLLPRPLCALSWPFAGRGFLRALFLIQDSKHGSVTALSLQPPGVLHPRWSQAGEPGSASSLLHCPEITALGWQPGGGNHNCPALSFEGPPLLHVHWLPCRKSHGITEGLWSRLSLKISSVCNISWVARAWSSLKACREKLPWTQQANIRITESSWTGCPGDASVAPCWGGSWLDAGHPPKLLHHCSPQLDRRENIKKGCGYKERVVAWVRDGEWSLSNYCHTEARPDSEKFVKFITDQIRVR